MAGKWPHARVAAAYYDAPMQAESIRQLALKAAPRLPTALSWMLALAVGWQLSALLWSLVPVPEPMRWRPPPAEPAAAPAVRGFDLSVITRAALFGVYEAPSVAVPAQPVLDAPDTRLDLTLTGIVAATDGRASRALIARGNGEEQPYAVGDMIQPGVILEQIHADRVILSRNGALETLRLDKDSPSSAAVVAPPPTPTLDANARVIAGQQAYELARIREELLANPAKASDYLRVQPARIGGMMRGYRIYPGRDRSIFSAAGLRPGDLVTAVNGVELDDPAKALQLLGDLSQARELTVTVERGGNPQTIHVRLD